MHLSYLLYASRLTAAFDRSTLGDILDTSQANNARDGLTGFLHVEAPHILQFLEGPHTRLQATLARIRQDNRHSDLQILAEGRFERRYFDGWTMALVDYTTFSLADLAEVKNGALDDMSSFDPMDLISLLSANESYLRMQPRASYNS
jgi:hypothetical protein